MSYLRHKYFKHMTVCVTRHELTRLRYYRTDVVHHSALSLHDEHLSEFVNIYWGVLYNMSYDS